MFEIFFAYAVTTALLLAFKATRWMGALALFVLICIAPILSSLALIFVALGCYVLFGKPNLNDLPWKKLRRD